MIKVIGGSGFIGSRLSNRFIELGLNFQILDINESPFFNDKRLNVDIRDRNNLRKALIGAELVINLAAEHRDDVTPISLYDEVNIEGSRNLCFVCEDLGIKKIIFTSSVAVYGFAPRGTNESGAINYFNDYGRTKWEAEQIYRKWLAKDPKNRSLTIIRPTVVFGERNRGNVYNLLKQISSGIFPMIGNGTNVKSMAYVENVAAFLVFSLNNKAGEHLFNYIDKPDFDMNDLVKSVKSALGKNPNIGFHWPYWLGYLGGAIFDIIAFLIGRKLPISRIRVKKFCSNTSFDSDNINYIGFDAPVSLADGVKRTIKFEFVDNKTDNVLFYSE